ncbi:MAG: matrixin family metalloprotease [Planctomycetota bacterium]|jgi:hypothetical protein
MPFSRCSYTLAAIVIVSQSGCGVSILPDSGPPRPTLNLTTLGLGESDTYFESTRNDLLEYAEPAQLGEASRVIRGEIGNANDVDVYDLGPMTRGSRIVVDLTADDTLDAALALFDENGASLLVNDHRNAFQGRKEPFIDVVLRRDSERCYLAISATPQYAAEGEYAVLARKELFQPIPDARPEDVLLVFNGGQNVRIGSRAPVDVPVFLAGEIDPRYEGHTARIMARVTKLVRDDYAEHDVQIFSTSEGTQWDGFMTQIFFGTYDPGLLGVAEGVDEFNSTLSQKAIIFTDTFAAFSPIDPTVDEISQALANVTSHEIGHLLGLVHSRDSLGIMDVTASLNQLLQDQFFRMSRLYDDVFPVGYQNAGQSLLDAVGGTFDLEPFEGAGLPGNRAKISWEEQEPARSGHVLSSCGLFHGH